MNEETQCDYKSDYYVGCGLAPPAPQDTLEAGAVTEWWDACLACTKPWVPSPGLGDLDQVEHALERLKQGNQKLGPDFVVRGQPGLHETLTQKTTKSSTDGRWAQSSF